MPDYYHVPALVLTALLLPAFGYLYRRFRDIRSLLWFLGFLFSLFHMLFFYHLGFWDFRGANHPWMTVLTQSLTLISSALFLGSLSPLCFRLGRFQILYVIPYTLPLLVYSALYYGVFHGIAPQGPLLFLFPGLGVAAVVAVLFWDFAKGSLPLPIGVASCTVFGVAAFWLCFRGDLFAPLLVADAGNHFVTALLLVCIYRRCSPGLFLGVLGFLSWTLSIYRIFPAIANNPQLSLHVIHVVVLGKVAAAVGMILLTLEHELDINKASEERERRARKELEAYTRLILSRRRLQDFDNQGTEICETIVAHSRFSQAALLLLGSSGRYRIAGSAGLSNAVIAALDQLAQRIPVTGFLAPGSAPPAVEHCLTLRLDLAPWFCPGDDLKRLRFTSVLATPLAGRTATEGALLLSGMRRCRVSGDCTHLRADDLLPIEILTSRLQSVRSQTMLLEKLIDSEKFAGLGQLAANVTQQLNNPLTVIMGYASLLEGAPGLDTQDRRGVAAILSESRRMRNTLESLSRVSWSQGDHMAAVSISELLADIDELHRSDFLRRSIQFRLSIAPGLPRAMCHAHQMRQAVLHCLHFATEAVQAPASAQDAPADRAIRLEATAEGNRVQILVAHTGPGFPDPERAFDPFVASQMSSDNPGLGLSLCSTILRDNNGSASAVNLEPRGAAILLELQSA